MILSSGEEEEMRIVDFLQQHLDDEVENHMERRRDSVLSLPLSSSVSSSSTTTATTTTTSTTITSTYSPRSLLSRWLLSLHKPPPDGGGDGDGGGDVGSGLGCLVRFPWPGKKQKTKTGEVVVGPSLLESAAEADEESACLRSVSASREEGRVASTETSAKLSISSGMKPDEVSFNLGIGVGLVFLLTKSATEFNKMIELRTQMEMLLKDIKTEIQRKNVISISSESNDNLALPVPDYCRTKSTNKLISLQNHRAPLHLVGEHCASESDGRSKCETTFENKSCLKMEQLEAELEVELERLQLNLEGENPSVLTGQYRVELDSENSGSSGSFNVCFREDNETKGEGSNEHCGVSALELERRLHELLETRQQERITELESALKCAERKLHEKELEICWWKETTRSASQHEEKQLFS